MTTREVLRCTHCRLVQFRGSRIKCPRCFMPLEPIAEIPKIVPLRVPPAIATLPTIGDRIRAIRMRAKATQRDICLRMGCPRTYISKLERSGCNPQWPQVIRLAAALQCDIREFFPAQDMSEFMFELESHVRVLTIAQMVAVLDAAKTMNESRSAIDAREETCA